MSPETNQIASAGRITDGHVIYQNDPMPAARAFLPPFDVDAVLVDLASKAHALAASLNRPNQYDDLRYAREILNRLHESNLAAAFDAARHLATAGQHVATRRAALSITILLTRVSDYLQRAYA